MDDFLSRLVDKSLGLTAVIQPRPISLFEPVLTGAALPAVPAMEIETVQEPANPLPPVNDHLKTETANPSSASLNSEPPPIPQDTILAPKTVVMETAVPPPTDVQRPFPTMKEDEPSSAQAAPHLTFQSPIREEISPPPLPANFLPTSAIVPRMVETVTTPTKSSVTVETTAVPSPIIQRMPATPPPLVIENTMTTLTPPPPLPIIQPMPVAPMITPPIPAERVEQIESRPGEPPILSPMPPPVNKPTAPLVILPAVAAQPVQPNQQHHKPELPERIIPEPTIAPPLEATAVIQPSITLYQERKGETVVSPEPAPTVEIRIGRIEVRATPPPAPAVKEQPAASPVMSLEDYLRQRENGGVP